MSELPIGVWLETNRPNGRRDRYRVRLYKNHISYHAGYFYTLEEAEAELAALKVRLSSYEAARRSNRDVKVAVPVGTLVGITQAMQEKRSIDPRAARVRNE